jgi:nitrite reductase (NO-forming)
MMRNVVVAAGLMVVLSVSAACASGRSTWTHGAVAAADASTAAAAAPGSPAAPSAMASMSNPATAAPATGAPATADQAAADVIEIHAFDLGFTPSNITVPAAGTYTLRLVNDGAILHDVTFADGTKVAAEAGQTAEGQVVIPEGGTTFMCSVPGHGPAGMTGTVTVEGAPAATAKPSEGGPAPDTTIVADENAPPPVTYDATAPAVLTGVVHDIDLVMTEQPMTVATGFVQTVWTFNGTVPGPVIRVKVGDTIRVHLKNLATNQMSHSIDFHASQVAWNDEMTSIAPGEEKLYEWTADYAGVWMYHCGTAPALHHIANGMYGMVIVEPAEGLPPVDSEFALVQSEWYLGPQGEVTSLEKASAAAPAPDFVVFNGVANQYKDAPLQVNTGERVRFFVLNAGPNEDSSFHIVGTIFDTVTKEGVHLVKGNDGDWGSQAVDLSPAQGAIIELTTKEDGLYPIVTHAFNFVGRGALGLLQAGDGDPTN